MSRSRALKFLVDESVEFGIVTYLREQAFDVIAVTEDFPSISDPEVLEKAYIEKRILVTNDLGFGRLVFREKQKSCGVILIRMPYAETEDKLIKLANALTKKKEDYFRVFTTITEKRVRTKKLPDDGK